MQKLLTTWIIPYMCTESSVEKLILNVPGSGLVFAINVLYKNLK
jgi:hypothetical protein